MALDSLHPASYRCGQLTAPATGAPVRISVCHCQRRSGSALAAQVRLALRKAAK